MTVSTELIMPVTMTATEQQEICHSLEQLGEGSCFTEWGSGGSTLLWYANMRDDQRLISIENHPVWALDVQQGIQRLQQQRPGMGPKFDYRVYETIDDGATFTPEESYYQPYVTADSCWLDSDLFLIDGRVRIWVAREIFRRAKKRSAVVYCHDYTNNNVYYDQLLDLYAGSEIISTPGTEFQMLKLYMQ